jgi:hypothetical protein
MRLYKVLQGLAMSYKALQSLTRSYEAFSGIMIDFQRPDDAFHFSAL